MPRVTDTRERVREVADRLAREGVEPTPTLVRKVLGKGSPNTIVDELRRWERERAGEPQHGDPAAGAAVAPSNARKPAQVSPQGLQQLGLEDLAELLRQAQGHTERLAGQIASMASAIAQTRELREHLPSLAEGVRELIELHQRDREWYQAELDKAYARFEAVQRMMMMSVAEARDQVKFWREEAQRQREDATSWRMGQGERLSALRDEIAFLRGKLEAYEGPVSTVKSSDDLFEEAERRRQQSFHDEIASSPGAPRPATGPAESAEG